MLLFSSTYLKQHLNMRMRVYYLDCHGAGLCCYLTIHMEILLYLLQLFYFHLRRTYYNSSESKLSSRPFKAQCIYVTCLFTCFI
jgi:hypothetical protein